MVEAPILLPRTLRSEAIESLRSVALASREPVDHNLAPNGRMRLASKAAARSTPPAQPRNAVSDSTPANLPTQPNFEAGNHGLLPAIAQDAESGRVLMMAWMNEEAWQETVRTGRVVYFSRSRNKLWRKGEESGHVQKVIEARIDCDADTILLLVHQTGAACHEGYASCFFRRIIDGHVEVTEERLQNPDEIYSK